jgi:hypothetical protein
MCYGMARMQLRIGDRRPSTTDEARETLTVRSLVMIFFAVTIFMLGSIAVDAEIARTDDATYGAVIWVVMFVSIGAFLVAAVIFARRDLAARSG